MMETDKLPGLFILIIASIFNGIVAMMIASLVVFPMLWLVLFIFGSGSQEAIEIISSKIDIIIVIFSIGSAFEIIDRIIRGKKKSKIIKIIRDKEDRW